MQDTKLFETILGLTPPWHIARVELTTDEQRVDLWLEHEPTRWPCPECGTELAGFDHAEERTWRHLDMCQFQTHVMPRFRASSVRRTASSKCACPGPKRGVASRC